MNHGEWTGRQTATTIRVDGHDLGVAHYEDTYHWVVEDRTGRYREELQTFLSETHTTEGGE